MRRRHRATAIAGALLWGARFAHGQVTASADIGSGRLDQTGLASAGVVTLGGELAVAGAHGGFTLGGLGARGSNGNGTGQATGSASLSGSVSTHSIVQLSVNATAFGATAQLPVTSLQLSAKQYYFRNSAALFYGVGGGRSGWAAATLPVATAQAGVARRHGVDRVVVAADLTLTQSEFRTATAAGEVRTVFDVRYADAAITWVRTLERATLTASGGARLGIDNVAARSGWLAAAASCRMADHLSLVAGAGRTPADFVRGVPDSRYLSLALRVESGAPGAHRPHVDTLSGPRLSIEGPGGQHVVRVRLASASQVEVMADFTEWQPVALTRSGSDWMVERPMAPGLHRVLIRVDGGAWIVPSNLPRGHDDFGAEVGLITVL